MSRLSRALDLWEGSPINTFYYNVKGFAKNLKTFLRFAWCWRPWDSQYTIDLLVELLKMQAKAMKNNDRHINTQKTVRRCYTAAGKLEKAYGRPMDRTLSYLVRKNPSDFRPVSGNTYMFVQSYTTNKRIYDGMYTAAETRARQEEAAAKTEAWQYLNKYIEHFWD